MAMLSSQTALPQLQTPSPIRRALALLVGTVREARRPALEPSLLGRKRRPATTRLIASAPQAGQVAILAAMLALSAITVWVPLATTFRETVQNEDKLGPALFDFGVFYSAGTLVAEGRGDELYEPTSLAEEEQQVLDLPLSGDSKTAFPFYNPPVVAGVLAPLALLPPLVAGGVFLAISFAVFLIVALLVARRAGLQGLDGWIWLAALLGSFATADTLFWGQTAFLVFGIWGLAYLLLSTGRERAGGAALALLAIKPHLLLLPLILLLWKRRWKELQGMSAVLALGVMLSIAVSGIGAVPRYPEFLLQAASWDDRNGIFVSGMFGWNAFYRSVFGPEAGMTFILIASLAMAAVTVGLCVYAWRGSWEPKERLFRARFAALILAALLVSPHLYSHEMVVLFLPIALLIGCMPTAFAQRLASLLAVAAWTLLAWHYQLLFSTGLNFTTPAVLGLLLVGALLARAPAPVADSSAKGLGLALP